MEQPRSPWISLLERLLGQTMRRLGWGLADQAVSSITNFAVSIYVVHALGARQFGAFSVAYVTYSFVLTTSRGLTTEPLMVRFSGASAGAWRQSVASCTGTSLVVGLVGGSCVVGVAMLLGGTPRLAFIALGLTLPGLMLQDAWRYAFFALGRGSQAFLNDAVWAVSLLPSLGALWVSGNKNVFWYVFTWGGTACLAAAFGMMQARTIPRLVMVRTWLLQHKDLGFRYLAENATFNAAAQMRTYAVALMLGLAAVGNVQASNTLMGPMTMLSLAMGLVAVPEGARVLRRSARGLPLFSVLLSGGLMAGGLIWGIVLLAALSRGVGEWALGPIWRSTQPLVLPQVLLVIGGAAGVGPGVALHALGAARRTLRVSIFSSAISLCCALAGAAVGGAVGTVCGAAVAAWVAALLLWWQLRGALGEFNPDQAWLQAPLGRRPGRHSRQWAAELPRERQVGPPDSPADKDVRREAQLEGLRVLLGLSRLEMTGPAYGRNQFPIAEALNHSPARASFGSGSPRASPKT